MIKALCESKQLSFCLLPQVSADSDTFRGRKEETEWGGGITEKTDVVFAEKNETKSKKKGKEVK